MALGGSPPLPLDSDSHLCGPPSDGGVTAWARATPGPLALLHLGAAAQGSVAAPLGSRSLLLRSSRSHRANDCHYVTVESLGLARVIVNTYEGPVHLQKVMMVKRGNAVLCAVRHSSE